ncbi:MAG TPA: ABC transporter permease [Candidatus Babeliales bacterium]|nr:ABC transporter permease [Candidatus Babeliales bacterium]
MPLKAISTMTTLQAVGYFFSDSWQLLKRNLLHIARDPDQVGGLIIQPVIYTVIFNYLLGGAINIKSGTYIDYLMPGILVMNIIFASSITFLSIANDLQKGIFDRLRSLPISQIALINSHILASVCRSLVVITVVVMLGLLIGFRTVATPAAWLGALGILLLATIAISSLMAIIAASGRSFEAAQQLAFICIMPLAMISPAAAPVETMPYLLRVIAQNQPFTHVIEAVRALLFGTAAGSHIMLAVLWCLGIAVLGFMVSSYRMHK